MNTKTENLFPVQFSQVEDEDAVWPAESAVEKKKFVEPEVSSPMDVLEATTFFQIGDSAGGF